MENIQIKRLNSLTKRLELFTGTTNYSNSVQAIVSFIIGLKCSF